MQGQADAAVERPGQPRGGEAEGARRGQDRHVFGCEMARQGAADAVGHGIAGGQHDHPFAAVGGDGCHGLVERKPPGDLLAGAISDQPEMALAADQKLGGLDHCLRRRRQSVGSVGAHADDGQPGAHGVAPGSRASALTVAAATALPPRRPASARYGAGAVSTRACFASAAPT